MSSNCGPCNGNGSFVGRTCAYCQGSGEDKSSKQPFDTASVRPLLAGEVSPGVVNHTTRFDNAIREAVSAAKSAGIPQGFIVALLHAHAARETSQLLE